MFFSFYKISPECDKPLDTHVDPFTAQKIVVVFYEADIFFPSSSNVIKNTNKISLLKYLKLNQRQNKIKHVN